MTQTKYVPVKVCGNPQAGGGYNSLIVCNNPSIELKDVVYGGVGANSYFFVIRIEPSQVVFRLMMNNVHSNGANRDGALSIAIAVPKGYRIDGGYSPFDVLIDLKDTFLSRCMTCRNKATEEYEYNAGRVPFDALNDTARKYVLVPAGSPWHTMNPGGPVGCLVLTEDRMAQLMASVQYAEFEKYSEILVAENIANTGKYAMISGLQIPRKPVYNIYVDGKLTSQVGDTAKVLTVVPNADTRYYDASPVSFCVDQLLNGDFIGGIQLDVAAESVYVTSSECIRPKERRIIVTFAPEENEAYFYNRRNHMALEYGKEPVRLEPDFSFVLKGEKLSMLDRLDLFRLTVSGENDYTIDNVPAFDSRTGRLTWRTGRNAKARDTGLGNTVVADGGRKKSNETSGSRLLELCIRVEKTQGNASRIEKLCNSGLLRVKDRTAGASYTKTRLDLLAYGDKKNPNMKAFRFAVPKSELGSVLYDVTLSDKAGEFHTTVQSAGNGGEDIVEIDFNSMTYSPRSILSTLVPNRLMAFIEGVVTTAAVMGAVVGVCSLLGNGGGQQPVQDTSAADTTAVVPPVPADSSDAVLGRPDNGAVNDGENDADLDANDANAGVGEAKPEAKESKPEAKDAASGTANAKAMTKPAKPAAGNARQDAGKTESKTNRNVSKKAADATKKNENLEKQASTAR